MKKIFTTPIISGKHKGKNIQIPSLDTTRSSKAILRESLFNTLQFEVIDKNFFEVFAGSGSVGLEALSRGAKMAYFIEKNRVAYETLKANIAEINSKSSMAIFGDSFYEFNTIHAMLQKDQVKTYFYFDPPFSIRENMDDIYQKTLHLIESIDINLVAMIIVEHMSQIELPQTIGVFELQKKKKFGKSTLSYYC